MEYHQRIEKVYQTISPYIKETPVLTSKYFSQKIGAHIFLKCENLQHTNSFKVRGAFNKISGLPQKKNKIAVATSGGNHGLAVTFAAHQFGMKAIIIVPEFVPQFRIEKIKALGADVIVHGITMDELNAKAEEFTQNPDYVYIHPFDDDDVIAGQGTVAYELLKQVPDLDVIVVSIGGGGLISGISQYAKSKKPDITIYGTQTIGADAMSKSLQADKIIAIPAVSSVATSLGATKVSERTFNIVKRNVNKVVTVSDEEAIHELKDILDQDKLLVEPASSCNLSALISGKLPNIQGKKIGVILCGGNFSLDQIKTYL